MDLYELFDENLIFLQKKFKSKNDIFEFLVEEMNSTGKITNKDAILKEFIKRESINTSGVNDQIAVPHIRTDSVTDFVAAFCTLKNGIDFHSLDGQDVVIILILLAPKAKSGEYLKLLARFSRIFKKADNRNQVLGFTENTELIEFIKSQEQ